MFFASDRGDPPHVHVRYDRKQVKFWLEPLIELEYNKGFAPHELNLIVKLIDQYRDFLLEKWHEFFGE